MILVASKENERKRMQSFKYLGALQKREPEPTVYYRKSKVDYSALIETQKERRMDK